MHGAGAFSDRHLVTRAERGSAGLTRILVDSAASAGQVQMIHRCDPPKQGLPLFLGWSDSGPGPQALPDLRGSHRSPQPSLRRGSAVHHSRARERPCWWTGNRSCLFAFSRLFSVMYATP